MLFQDAPDGARLACDLLPLIAVDQQNLFENRAEAGPAIFPIGWEVGAAVEDLACGGQECGQRPPALTGDGLNRALVTGINVGTLVAIHLDARKILVEELAQSGVLVRLTVHDVTPVAPHRADIQQNRPIGGLRRRKRFRAPRVPMHRLVGG